MKNQNKQTREVKASKLREKLSRMACRFKIYAYLCGAFHLNKATVSPTAIAAGLFYGRGHRQYSSVPCGALMRPLPCSRWKSTGSGTFFVPQSEKFTYCPTSF